MKRELAALSKELECNGPTIDVELKWLDLMHKIEAAEIGERPDVPRAWHFLGHEILDRRNNSGAALRQLIEAVTYIKEDSSEKIWGWRSVLLYAAFVADDKAAVVSALSHLVNFIDEMTAIDLRRLRLLLLDYMSVVSVQHVPKVTETLLRRIFGACERTSVSPFLTGEELAQELDPGGSLRREVSATIGSAEPRKRPP